MSDNKDISFPARLKTKLPAGFADSADSMGADEIKTKMIESQRTIVETERDMKGDVKLNDLKEQKKEVEETYKEVIVVNNAMIKYLIYTLEKRGL